VASFRFLHTADIHLDSPLHGIARYEGVPAGEVRGATRAAFDNLIQCAIDEAVDFVLIAGDLFDGDWKDMGTGLYFSRAMGRLHKAGIPVFLLAGNHDAASVLTRSVPQPPNVRLFSSRRPETHRLEEIGVAIHGQSFANASVSENLVLNYPAADENLFNIGLLHTALGGREGHASYAPCDIDHLISKRYHYWALGHVHNREIVSTQPHIVFPGNIQGRSVREVGPKGALIVDVVDREVVSVNPVELDVVRWAIVDVDCTFASADEVQSRIRDGLVDAHSQFAAGRPMVARIVLAGENRDAAEFRDRNVALRDDVRAMAASVSPDLWIEQVLVRLQEPKREVALDVSDDLSLLIGTASSSGALADALRDDLASFISSSRATLGEASEDEELRVAANADDWARILNMASQTLQSRLARED